MGGQIWEFKVSFLLLTRSAGDTTGLSSLSPLSRRVALSAWLLLFIVWSLLHVHLYGPRVLRTFLDTVWLLFRWWLTAWSLHSSLLGTAWSPFSAVCLVSFPEMFSSLSSAPSSCKVFIVLPPLPEIKGERIVSSSSSSSSSSTVTTYLTGMTAGIVFILWKWRSMESFFRNFNTYFLLKLYISISWNHWIYNNTWKPQSKLFLWGQTFGVS